MPPMRYNFNLPEQDYKQLKEECLNKGKLFIDPEFPIENALDGIPKGEFKWMRPKEIEEKAQFVTDGVSRFDVNQGKALGDCWFLASAASLTLHPDLFRKVIPEYQTFQDPYYAGIFHFRFWNYDKWVDVVIDDRLPLKIYDDNSEKMFTFSTDKTEFWISLLEKAYAKFKGSYKGIHGGSPFYALADFSGGLVENIDMISGNPPADLFLQIMQAVQNKSIMAASIMMLKGNKDELGLSGGHAYSITGAAKVEYEKDGLRRKKSLVRIRNPWGPRNFEWKGEWRDDSNQWNYLSTEERNELKLIVSDDGEFWMSYQDFIEHFDVINICHWPGAKQNDLQVWDIRQWQGEWTIQNNVSYDRESSNYCENPQFRIFVTANQDYADNKITISETNMDNAFEHNNQINVNNDGSRGISAKRTEIGNEVTITDDDISEESDSNGRSIVYVQLTKKRRNLSNVALDLYKLPDGMADGKLDAKFFKEWKPVASLYSTDGMPEIIERLCLTTGQYCLVPICFQIDVFPSSAYRSFQENLKSMMRNNDERDLKTSGEFLLQVYTKALNRK